MCFQNFDLASSLTKLWLSLWSLSCFWDFTLSQELWGLWDIYGLLKCAWIPSNLDLSADLLSKDHVQSVLTHLPKLHFSFCRTVSTCVWAAVSSFLTASGEALGGCWLIIGIGFQRVQVSLVVSLFFLLFFSFTHLTPSFLPSFLPSLSFFLFSMPVINKITWNWTRNIIFRRFMLH